jgi:hypothetical protein
MYFTKVPIAKEKENLFSTYFYNVKFEVKAQY